MAELSSFLVWIIIQRFLLELYNEMRFNTLGKVFSN
jgi:hypothetical protein